MFVKFPGNDVKSEVLLRKDVPATLSRLPISRCVWDHYLASLSNIVQIRASLQSSGIIFRFRATTTSNPSSSQIVQRRAPISNIYVTYWMEKCVCLQYLLVTYSSDIIFSLPTFVRHHILIFRFRIQSDHIVKPSMISSVSYKEESLIV